MVTIDISHDVEEAMRDVDDFWRGQIPFATSGALNDTIFDVRKRNAEVTYPKAFEVRNKSLARALWRVSRARKGDLEATLYQHLDRDWTERQAMGGTKTGRGSRVAVPVDPAEMRKRSGAIRAPLKPRRLLDQKNTFVVKKGNASVIFRRRKGQQEPEAMYVLVNETNIKKRFRFFEDAEMVALRVFGGHWTSRMNKAIRTSRFYL